MTADSQGLIEGKPAQLWLPRFPVRWAIESASVERNFARLLWLLVPLQYYVVANVDRGLAATDVIPAVVITLLSVVIIFLLSCLAALGASWLSPRGSAQSETYTGRVRMWVIALMICTAAGYFLFALLLVAKHLAVGWGWTIYDDLVTDGLMEVAGIVGLGDWADKLHGLVLAFAYFIYAFAAIGAVFAGVGLFRLIVRPGPAGPETRSEPDVLSIGLIVTAVMLFANFIATWD